MSVVGKVRAIQLAAVGDAGDKLAKLDRAVQTVMEIMKEIHGGEWDRAVHHDACFVSVSRNFRGRPKGATAAQ